MTNGMNSKLIIEDIIICEVYIVDVFMVALQVKRDNKSDVLVKKERGQLAKNC